MLQNKVVIVTGSAQGIGKHAAKTFAQQKARIVIADFNEEQAKKTAAELSAHSETFPIRVDVRDEASVRGMVASASPYVTLVDAETTPANPNQDSRRGPQSGAVPAVPLPARSIVTDTSAER